MRTSYIQLRNADGSHCRWIGAIELRDLTNREEVAVYQKKNKVIARLNPVIEPLRSMHEASPPSITVSDMLANVGLTSNARSTSGVSRGRQAAARMKIAVHADIAITAAEVKRRGARLGLNICDGVSRLLANEFRRGALAA